MMTGKICTVCFAFFVSVFFTACLPDTTIKHYPADSIEGIIDGEDVKIDKEFTTDKNGSIHISKNYPLTVKLYETGDLDIEESTLVYQAKVRTRDVKGQVYLEMLCNFPGKGEFFSRSLNNTLTGNEDWTTLKTPFKLKKGENPDNVKINIVLEGTGRVWIDDIRLKKEPLR